MSRRKKQKSQDNDPFEFLRSPQTKSFPVDNKFNFEDLEITSKKTSTSKRFKRKSLYESEGKENQLVTIYIYSYFILKF